MLDLIFDAFDAISQYGEDALDALNGIVGSVDLGDVLLIASTIYVTNLTVNSVRDVLRNRQELKENGATHVIIKDFIDSNDRGYTEVSFAALNEQNEQVGTFSMEGRSCSGLYVGQKIAI